MPQALKDKEQLVNEIMKNIKTSNELLLQAEAGEESRQRTLEVEKDIVRWLAVGQAAATRLYELLKEKKPEMKLENEGQLLLKLGIPHEKLQWSVEEETFY